MKRLLAAVALAGAALALPGGAIAEPLAAVALAPDPLASTLVGPSGQVWQPDGKGGWTRGGPGGVAADVGGAVVAAQLVVVGKATPAYRLDPDGWRALRLGERGKTVMGVGPHPAFAIGRNVFVWKAKAWVRVGTAPAGVVALWASSDSKLYVAGADRVWRLAGKRLVEHAAASLARFGSGATPLAITTDGALYDVAAKAAAPLGAGFTALALYTGSLWGRPTWGTYWAWDARMTSELILLFLYLGVIALRNAIDDPRRADRACAVLSLVGAINVPIIYFSVKWWNTLHQGSSVSMSAAPKMAAIMLSGMLIMSFAAWFYCIAVSLHRVRSIIVERERGAAWVGALREVRAG